MTDSTDVGVLAPDGAQLPTRAEIDAEANPTRKAILEAIVRVLAGTPRDAALRGRVSVNALAMDAGIKRDRLTTGAHRDLRLRFEALKRVQEQVTTAKEHELLRINERLAEQLVTANRRHEAAKEERDRLKLAVQALAQQVQVLTIEKIRLQDRMKTGSRVARGNVVQLDNGG